MSSIDHHTYVKHKRKYNLMKQISTYNEKFVFIHFTKNFHSLLNIINDGVLYAGKFLEPEQHFMLGEFNSEYVYTQIYFDDLKNLSHARDYSLILSKNMFFNHKKQVLANKGWGFKPIHLTKDKNKNIKIIKKYLQTLDELPEKIKELSPFYHHEILFEDEIKLKNNLVAIVCNHCSDKNVEILKAALEKRKIRDVKILTRNIIPSYDNLYK